MEILSIILSMIAVVQGLTSIKDRIKANENKEEVSSLLLSIGNLLEEVSKEMKMGVYPVSKCSQLNSYLLGIKHNLSNYIEESELDTLTNLMNEAFQVERLFGELQAFNGKEKVLNFNKLDEAAGAFIAASNLYKVK